MRVGYRAGILFVLAAGCGSGASGGQASNPTTGPKFAQSMTITAVAMFQGTKVDIVKTDDSGNTAHVDKPTAPVVEGRPGMVRVYVSLGDAYQAHDVTGELHVADANGNELFVVSETKTIGAASSDKDTGSTFNFVLENNQIVPGGAQFRVSLVDPDQGVALTEKKRDTAIGARWPQDGTLDSFGTVNTGDSIKVVVVPIKYDADGSGRLPDTSDSQMQAFKNRLMQFYPVKRVDFTMHAPWSWTTPKLEPADQNAWSQLVLSISELRASEKAASDVFYFVLFDSYATWRDYLVAGSQQGGAIIGVGDARGPSTPVDRNVAVVGYPGAFNGFGIHLSGIDTLPQELAHTVGRLHAPCAPMGQVPVPVDAKYPYKNAAIGAWGYDIFAKTFIDPSSNAKDYMSYCFDSIWTSDYTYAAMATQLAAIYAPKTQAPIVNAAPAAPTDALSVTKIGAEELRRALVE